MKLLVKAIKDRESFLETNNLGLTEGGKELKLILQSCWGKPNSVIQFTPTYRDCRGKEWMGKKMHDQWYLLCDTGGKLETDVDVDFESLRNIEKALCALDTALEIYDDIVMHPVKEGLWLESVTLFVSETLPGTQEEPTHPVFLKRDFTLWYAPFIGPEGNIPLRDGQKYPDYLAQDGALWQLSCKTQQFLPRIPPNWLFL